MHIAPLAFCILLVVAAGCATSPVPQGGAAAEDCRSLLPLSFTTATRRPFNFQTDTFSYSNQLVWDYRLDPTTGKTVTTKREPPPTYTHRCFVVLRAARQFFNHAQFDPTLPRATNYLSIVRQALARSARKESSDANRIVIPGYADLREFSRDHTQLLQDKCGGPWQSYFQRGHWRMLLPFTQKHQQRTAEDLIKSLEKNRPQILHVVRFPSLAINHALLIYAAEQDSNQIRFLAYDPNDPNSHSVLTFKNAERRFFLPGNPYFPRGGRVDVYPIFTGRLY